MLKNVLVEKSYNIHVPHLPKHLLQYVVDQNYKHYTSIDQAVWRYVMRQNVHYLPSVCHGSYIDGLKKTGLSVDSIPSMYGMTRILKDIGWYAVAVDGFIPPTVFMEFQAHNVLVIAADIRQINHIGYTPAPDILHEAAGHAPIIADKMYSDYLKKFGEIGSKAFSSSKDLDLFNAIRELSILKEAPSIDQKIIKKSEDKVLRLQSEINDLSEMARIRNLHWWTVEYGLIGELEHPKIYGAGLLSSISESVNCLSDKVKKIPYDLNAADIVFDITKEQPQLFVAKDFNHLNMVLEEFSETMAFKKGGDYAVELAIESKRIATCEFSSGVQVSGCFSELIKVNKEGAYIKTQGPTALSYKDKEIVNHGTKYHSDGFGAPIGSINNIVDINSLKIQLNKEVEIRYDTGVIVKGELFDFIENDRKEIILLSLKNCSVVLFKEGLKPMVLFDPSWGVFDLIIGDQIISAYPSPADRTSFPIEKINLSSNTIHPDLTLEYKTLDKLYYKIRNMRSENIFNDSIIQSILNQLINDFNNDWLLSLEICEFSKDRNIHIYDQSYNNLMSYIALNPENEKLIMDGLKIIK